MTESKTVLGKFYSFDNDSSKSILRTTQDESSELLLTANEDISPTNSELGGTDSIILENSKNLINIACTNARSLADKINSLITLFETNSLHFTILTETWLTPKLCPPRVLSDLTTGANLSFIRRDRGSRGGGVAVCYDPTKIRLSKLTIDNDTDKEIVCAVGNCCLTKRKIVILAVYLPPSMQASQLSAALETVVEYINKAKTKFPDPIVFLGGDFNNKNLGAVLTLSLIHI